VIFDQRSNRVATFVWHFTFTYIKNQMGAFYRFDRRLSSSEILTSREMNCLDYIPFPEGKKSKEIKSSRQFNLAIWLVISNLKAPTNVVFQSHTTFFTSNFKNPFS
jgi:hypothetical protein